MAVNQFGSITQDIEPIYKSKALQVEMLADLDILKKHNKVMGELGWRKVSIDEIENFQQDKVKGLDGGTTARGSGFLQRRYNNNIRTIVPRGGVLAEAGADIQMNVSGAFLQTTGLTMSTGSGYVDLATNASATYSGLNETSNDQAGTVYSETANFLLKFKENFIRKSLLAGILDDPQLIIDTYRQNFADTDTLLVDELGIDSIYLSTSVSGSAQSGASVGSLVQTFLNLKAGLRAKGVGNIDLHLSPRGYNRLFSERANSTGQFLIFNLPSGNTVMYNPVRNPDGSDKAKGLVGILDGSKVYINNGVRDNYTVTGNNITGFSGGVGKTAMFVGDTSYLLAGTNENFAGGGTQLIVDDVVAARKGAIYIARTIGAGACIVNPDAFGYCHFDV